MFVDIYVPAGSEVPKLGHYYGYLSRALPGLRGVHEQANPLSQQP